MPSSDPNKALPMDSQLEQPLLSDAMPSTEPSRQKSVRNPAAPIAIGLSILTGLVVLSVFQWSTVNQLEASAALGDVQSVLQTILAFNPVHFTGTNETAAQALARLGTQSSALVLVTAGPQLPQRRGIEEPFLSVGPGVSLPVDAINRAVLLLEQRLTHTLFPIHIRAADFSQHTSLFSGYMRPYAVWEAGAGVVLVDKDVAGALWAQPQVRYMTGSLMDQLVGHLLKVMPQVSGLQAKLAWSGLEDFLAESAQEGGDDDQQSPAIRRVASLLGPALAAAVAAAFAAAPPLWFCIVCPAVLGLVAPLLINIGLNQLAGLLCTQMKLPDDQCFDLLLGALGLGFILSLASAIPIFMVCQLQACAKGGQNGTDTGSLLGSKGFSSSLSALKKAGMRWARPLLK